MSDDDFGRPDRARASPLKVALARWQHATGDFWPYVCAAPFVSAGLLPESEGVFPPLPTGEGEGEGRSILSRPPPAFRGSDGGTTLTPTLSQEERERTALSRGERDRLQPPPSELRLVINAVVLDERVAIVVDLRPTDVLPSTRWLNRRGFVVVPAIQRWVAAPAVLTSRVLIDHLVRFGAECRRLPSWRGVVFILDGDRRGRREVTKPVDVFDNRYSYTVSRFPSPSHLQAQGVKKVYWVSTSGIAPDLEAYVTGLLQEGLPIAGRGGELGDREVSGETTNGSPSTLQESEAIAGRPGVDVGLSADALGPGTTLTLNLSQREREAKPEASHIDARGQAKYRRFVRRAQTRALLVDHLIQGEPYPSLDALVLTAEDDACLRRITGVFAGAFDRVARLLARDVSALVEMGFPWVAAELLRDEMPRIPIIGRFDFVRDERGTWWLLEFNADTPSGVREAIGVEEALLEIAPVWRGFTRPNAGLADALASAFVDASQGLPSGSALGLLTDAAELEDLAQMAFTQCLLSGRLARLGVPVVLGDVDNLRVIQSGLLLNGRRIGALYRYIAFESMFGSPAFVGIGEAAASGRLRLLNGLFGLLLQHKGLMAWLWSNRADSLFSLDERAAISEHLPATWILGEGKTSPAPEMRPEDVVVKQAFGREGEEVYLGQRITPEQLALLRRRRTYIAQQRVEVGSHHAIVPTSSGHRLASGHVTVGAFSVNGRWAGYYSRFGGEIINAQAKWLATLVEPSSESATSVRSCRA